jgi:Protein of unknown function (DUF3563)
MKTKAVWTDSLALLAACASPGSALAYHQGQGIVEPMMPHRNMRERVLPRVTSAGTAEPKNGSPAAGSQSEEALVRPAAGWFRRLFARLEEWSWKMETREREAYLAQAQNLSDLEARMRRLDDAVLSRGRALR